MLVEADGIMLNFSVTCLDCEAELDSRLLESQLDKLLIMLQVRHGCVYAKGQNEQN